jgi:endonuclease/exonuclease/phosphatase family metal-dependent hydrolase
MKGKPDITGCLYGMRFEIECKAEGKEARPLQKAVIRKWKKSGAVAGVAHNVEEAQELLQPILDKKEESSHHQFQGQLENGARIDWILVNRKLRPFDIFLDKVQKKGIYPSDHFPVKGVFHLE